MYPPPAMVPAENAWFATRKIVVVTASEKRCVGAINVYEAPVVYASAILFTKGAAAEVAVVVLMLESKLVVTLLVPENVMLPHTSQSPAVKLMLVILAAVEFVSETPDGTEDVMYSPTLPACALLFVVVPTMPATWAGVIVLLAVTVVAATLAGAVDPSGNGEANKAVNPAPLTAPVAANVVTAAVLGVVAPRDPLSAPLVDERDVKLPVLAVTATPDSVPLVACTALTVGFG